MLDIIIGITGIVLIILGYFIGDTKKYIREYIRRKKGVCIGCGAPSGTSNWSIYGLSDEYIRCDLCNRVQFKPNKG